jgi:hypothetical protein
MILTIHLTKIKLILAILLVIGKLTSSIAQETFQLLFQNPHDEMAQSMIENKNHEFIGVGFENVKPYYEISGRLGKIWKFKNFTDTLTRTYSFHDTACAFSNIFQLGNGNYHVFCSMYEPPEFDIFSLSIVELNEHLEIILQKRLEFGATHLISNLVKAFSDKYYIFGTGYWGDTLKSYVVKLDKSLNITAFKSATDPAAGDGYYMDCILSPDSSQLWTVANFPHDGEGCHLIVYDTSLNLVNVKPLPDFMNLNAGIHESYSHNITLKRYVDDKFIIGSVMRKMENWESNTKIGFSVLDTSMQWQQVQYIGSDDTSYYTSYARPTFDFRSTDSIFFTGTKNQISSFFPQKPSWIMAGALDSVFQPYYINYYGGDAYYHANSMLLTSDGGSIILADRYDKNTQGYEYDVFFLKLNSQGLITEVNQNEIYRQSPFLISPNPFENSLQIELFNETASLTLIDLSGREVQKEILTKGVNKINTSKLHIGIYVAKVELNHGKFYSEKIIKIK